VFIRSGRPKAPLLYHETPRDFEFGKGVLLRDGSDLTVIANGLLVGAAMVAAEQLASEGISTRVIDMPTVKPLDEALAQAAAEETGAIVVAEEHLRHGGLGSVVAQAVGRLYPCPLEFVGLDDTYAESGDPAALMRKYGLTAQDVAAAARRVLNRRATATPI
jgi:transketolase